MYVITISDLKVIEIVFKVIDSHTRIPKFMNLIIHKTNAICFTTCNINKYINSYNFI